MRGREKPEFDFAGAKGEVIAEEILKKAEKIRSDTGREVIPINPMAVCGSDHLVSAHYHTRKAFSEGFAVGRVFSAEFFRHLTGERQLSKAIKKGGVRDGDEVVLLSELSVKEVLEYLGLMRDDSILECSEEKARYLGIENPRIKPDEMVLELVAMVAIL